MATAKTEKFYVYEFNGLTNEAIKRELTDEELAQRELDAIETARIENEKVAKAAARASALAKLAELGLTEEEIAAL